MGSRVGSHPGSYLGSRSKIPPGIPLSIPPGIPTFFLHGVRYGGAGLSTDLKYITMSLLASTGTHYYE